MLGAGIIGINIARKARGKNISPIQDTFTRADSTTAMGKANSGQSWTNIAGTWGIRTNKGYNASDTNGALATIDTGGATRYTASFDASGDYNATNNRFYILILHYVDSANYLSANVSTANTYFTKRIAGVGTSVIQPAFTPVTGTVYNVKVVAVDGRFDLYVDSVLKGSYTCTASEKTLFLPSGKVGVRSSKSGTPTTNADFDNFIVTIP